MSNIYYSEPPTNGKVLLKTTIGDIEIELFSREAPKACKNFINHCLNKYYCGTIFHRVVKGFIVQGGDPTGTGNGGVAFDGTPFVDEFHQRLKFIRRGLVAMANASPNDNRSQFFITLGACQDLNNKNTIFGSVVNNTIFNVLKMEECEIGADDRPLYPPRILKTIVVENPFTDTVIMIKDEEEEKKNNNNKIFDHVKAIKNKNLLSFGDNEDDDEIETFSKKIVSSHDALNDPNLSKEPVLNIEELPQKNIVQPPIQITEIIEEEVQQEIQESEIDKIRAQQKQIQQSVLSTRKRVEKIQNTQLEKDNKINEQTLDNFGPLRKDFTKDETISEYILSNYKYAKRKKVLPILNKSDQRELLTLGLLKNFNTQLTKIQQDAIDKEKERNDKQETTNNQQEIEVDTNWMNHMLSFDKPSPYISHAFDANVETVDRYDITDPRNPMNLRKMTNKK